VLELAIAMCDAISEIKTPHGEPLQLRIGIDAGPVVAGVIGRHKFSYDVWGDTVNTASRMESHGVPGRIQVTERVARAAWQQFDFEPRRSVAIKGKGTLTTLLLIGARSSLPRTGYDAMIDTQVDQRDDL
jgi:guanylate cyclase